MDGYGGPEPDHGVDAAGVVTEGVVTIGSCADLAGWFHPTSVHPPFS
jgi:hypothetical protein